MLAGKNPTIRIVVLDCFIISLYTRIGLGTPTKFELRNCDVRVGTWSL